MDKVKGVCRSAAVLAALVLVFSVAGAFADGVHGDHDGTFVKHDSFKTWFNPTYNSYDSWNFDKKDWKDGKDFKGFDESWSKNWCDKNYFKDNDKSCRSTATPEPGTLLLLGMGVILVSIRRRATQA